MVDDLGTIERIDNLRSVWQNEATDFTPWLQKNIGLLSESLGLDIQLVESEVSVGDFSVDLVGEEPSSGRPVIIENQLERTNHDHLGKLLTYSAGKNGGVIIWVAKDIRSEHQAALDWLNNATQGNIDFFGVELELLRIQGSQGFSAIAPNFKVVVAPKNVGPTALPQDTERGRRYQAFFQDVLDRLKNRQPGVIRTSKVGMRSWLNTASGKCGFGFPLAFASRARFRIELYIAPADKETNKRIFAAIQEDQQMIESQLGVNLNWERLDNRKACRVAWYWDQPVTIMDPSDKLDRLKAWTVDNYFRFRDALSGYLGSLPAEFEFDLNEEFDEPDAEAQEQQEDDVLR
ncbi:MAG: hypothetical protein BZY75_03470 [SAR202 cluster bacterium Io17-Chloro-G7]|nr:MAG: hypothetical protein BZY75_03470 [SAR202 cluster bacterium Io17-Chloro-G7]